MNTKGLNDIIQWDVRTWKKALEHWEDHVDWNRISNGLELGAREGGLSMWLSKKGINTVCSDYTDSQKRATPLHTKHNVDSNISYQDIDASSIPYEDHFDLIIFKSIIGGIGQGDNKAKQKQVFNEIYKALKPGGVLLFAENLTATKAHQKLRARHNKWGENWRYITISELEEFLHPFESFSLKTTGLLGTLGRNEKQKSFLTKIDEISFNHVTPSTWRYMGYGIAHK